MALMEKYRVVEWKIENFSCWCEAVHGKSIQSPGSFHSNPFGHVKLYPRGYSGQDDHMNVHFCDVKIDIIVVLVFVCSDGSSICSQQLETVLKGDSVPGPIVNLKFEEVVAQLKKADKKDQITLRFSFQSDVDYEQCMCTTIGVCKVSFEIDPILAESVESDQPKDISYFRYTSKIGKGIFLKIARQNERIHLIMEQGNNRAILVESCASMLSSDNDLVRKEVVKHVLTFYQAWKFSESLTVKELKEKGITILLKIKITNGEIFERYNNITLFKNVRVLKSNSETRLTEQMPSKRNASSNQSDDSVTDLSKDLMCLYQDQDFSDFQLKCDDISFSVHQNILSARSPVFKTMLSTDMQEAESGQVVIDDLDPSTLGLFLTYLYTGAVEDLECDRALKLYYVADKYQVPSLKRECANFLTTNMSISNVCDVLTLADKHKNDDLIAVSRDFILNNFNDVLVSKEWASFMEVEPLLAVKTVTHFAQKKYVEKSANLP